LTLECYKLAKYYGIDPSIFLLKPMTEIERHARWTSILAERANIEASADYGDH